MLSIAIYALGIILGERQKIRNWSYCAKMNLAQQIWPLNKRRAANKMEKLFPTVIIILMVCAAVVYLCLGNLKKSIFWFSLATANSCVVY